MNTKTPPFDDEISLDHIIMGAQSLKMKTMPLPARTNAALKRPVFVVGSPRSGTTVLGNCLGAHPMCATAEESLILLPLWRIYVDLYASGLPTHVTHLRAYTSESDLISALGKTADTIFTGLLQRTNATHYVDHTPWYGVIAPFIQALYPDARFIHIIRDGRQVVRSLEDSYQKGFKWAGHDMSARCHIWTQMVSGINNMLNTNTIHTLEYKSLSHDPETTLHDITDFLGLTFDPAMLKPLTIHHAASSSDSSYGATRISERFTSDGWPIDWNESDRSIFIKIAGDEMQTLFKDDWCKRRN